MELKIDHVFSLADCQPENVRRRFDFTTDVTPSAENQSSDDVISDNIIDADLAAKTANQIVIGGAFGANSTTHDTRDKPVVRAPRIMGPWKKAKRKRASRAALHPVEPSNSYVINPDTEGRSSHDTDVPPSRGTDTPPLLDADVPPSLHCEKNCGALSTVYFDTTREIMEPPVLSPAEKDCPSPAITAPPKRSTNRPDKPNAPRQSTRIEPCYAVLSCVNPYLHPNTHTSYRNFKRTYRECTNMCKKMHFKRQLKAGKDVFNVKAPSRKKDYQYYMWKEEKRQMMIRLSKRKSRSRPVAELQDQLKKDAHNKHSKQDTKASAGRIRRYVAHVPKDFMEQFKHEEESEWRKHLEEEELLEQLICIQNLEKQIKADVEVLKKQVELKRSAIKHVKKPKTAANERLPFYMKDGTVSFSGRQRKANRRYGDEFARTEREVNDCRIIAMVADSIKNEKKKQQTSPVKRKDRIAGHVTVSHEQDHQTVNCDVIALKEDSDGRHEDKDKRKNCSNRKPVSGRRKGIKRKLGSSGGIQRKRQKQENKREITKANRKMLVQNIPNETEISSEALSDEQDYTSLSDPCSNNSDAGNSYAHVKELLQKSKRSPHASDKVVTNENIKKAKVPKNANTEGKDILKKPRLGKQGKHEKSPKLKDESLATPKLTLQEKQRRRNARRRQCHNSKNMQQIVGERVKEVIFNPLKGEKKSLLPTTPSFQSPGTQPLTCTVAPSIQGTNTVTSQIQSPNALSVVDVKNHARTILTPCNAKAKMQLAFLESKPSGIVDRKLASSNAQTVTGIVDKKLASSNATKKPATVSVAPYLISVNPNLAMSNVNTMNKDPNAGTPVAFATLTNTTMSSQLGSLQPSYITPQLMVPVQKQSESTDSKIAAPESLLKSTAGIPMVSNPTNSNAPVTDTISRRFVLVKVSGQACLLPLADPKAATNNSFSLTSAKPFAINNPAAPAPYVNITSPNHFVVTSPATPNSFVSPATTKSFIINNPSMAMPPNNAAVVQMLAPQLPIISKNTVETRVANSSDSKMQSVTLNSSTQHQGQTIKTNTTASCKSYSMSNAAPKVVTAAAGAGMLHRKNTLPRDKKNPNHHIYDFIPYVPKNATHTTNTSTAGVTSSTTSSPLISNTAATTTTNTVRASASVSILKTIKQEPIDADDERVSDVKTYNQGDEGVFDSEGSVSVAKSDPIEDMYRSTQPISPCSSSQLAPSAETNEQSTVPITTADEQQDDATEPSPLAKGNEEPPKAFSESLSDRGEKLRKLKALLRLKQKAVESIRVSTKKSAENGNE